MMKQAQMQTFQHYLWGFFVGGTVGAATALLLAPHSGEETRQIIRERTMEARDKTAKKISTAQEGVADKISDIRDQAGELQQRGKDFIDEKKAEVQKKTGHR
ncbi:MAG: YtxH domain-containing protein [Chloroflexota bacterium]